MEFLKKRKKKLQKKQSCPIGHLPNFIEDAAGILNRC
jgi:hypothetical protein